MVRFGSEDIRIEGYVKEILYSDATQCMDATYMLSDAAG